MPSPKKTEALSRTVTAERDGRPQLRPNTRTGASRVSRASPQDVEARLLIHLSADDLRWLRHHAVDLERSMSDIVRGLLRDYRRRAQASSPGDPRV